MRTSEKLENLSKALVEFQKEAKGIAKDGSGYNYQYMTIDQILNLVRPSLAKVGINLAQDVHSIVVEGGKVIDGVSTRLTHVTGEFMETSPLYIEATSTKGGKSGPASITPQDHGSAITYAKRYQLVGILGLNADIDDDAGIYQQNAKNWGQKITDEQIKALTILMQQKGIDANGMQAIMAKSIKVIKRSIELSFEEAETIIKELSALPNVA